MALFNRNRSPRDDESVSPWAVVAAVAAAGVLAGVAYLLTHQQQRRYVSISTRANASDGMLLTTSCMSVEDGVCRITIRNTASRTSVDPTEDSPSEVSIPIPVLAKEVCLYIRVDDGDFDSVPQYTDGRPAAHVRTGRELIVFLGDMQPSEEVSLRIAVGAGDEV